MKKPMTQNFINDYLNPLGMYILQIDILIAHTELRCDLTKKFIKKNKPFKLVWVIYL